MGKRTEYIWEYLQRHAEPGERITNIEDMTNIALRSIFEDAPLEVLHPSAQNFPTQFTLHYMKYEFGDESETLWKISLNDAIINNANKINFIYDNIMRQYYDKYEKTKKLGHGTKASIGSKKSNDIANKNTTKLHGKYSSGSSMDNKNRYAMDSNDSDIYGTEVNELTDRFGKRVDNGGSELYSYRDNNQHSEFENRDNTNLTDANQLNNEQASDETTYGKTDTITRKQTEYNKGNEAKSDYYNEQTKDENEKKYENVNAKEIKGGYQDINKADNKNNSMDINFDTPQGSLGNLRSPNSPPGGSSGDVESSKGIGYTDGRTYNYMSSASEHDATTWTNDTTSHIYGIDDVNSGKYEEITKEKVDIDGETNFDIKTVTHKSLSDSATITNRPNITYNNEDEPVMSNIASVDYDGNLTYTDHNQRRDSNGSDESRLGGKDTTEKTIAGASAGSGSNIDVENINRGGSDSKDASEMKSDSRVTQEAGQDVHASNGQTRNINRRADINSEEEQGTSAEFNHDDESENAYGTEANDAMTDSFNNEDASNDEDFEGYTINYNTLKFDNDYMDELWDIFDDLFCLIY